MYLYKFMDFNSDLKKRVNFIYKDLLIFNKIWLLNQSDTKKSLKKELNTSSE